MPSFAIREGAIPVIFFSCRKISPFTGFMKPDIVFRRVVFPAPLLPITETISPFSRRRLMLRKSSRPLFTSRSRPRISSTMAVCLKRPSDRAASFAVSTIRIDPIGPNQSLSVSLRGQILAFVRRPFLDIHSVSWVLFPAAGLTQTPI